MKPWKVIIMYIDKQGNRRASSRGLYMAKSKQEAIRQAMAAWRDKALLTGNYRFEAEAVPTDRGDHDVFLQRT